MHQLSVDIASSTIIVVRKINLTVILCGFISFLHKAIVYDSTFEQRIAIRMYTCDRHIGW